jgi:trehalose 2-sulfotransferase
MMKSYLICTVPRSGSWLLADLLEQTDLAGRPEEYFRPDYRSHWTEEWGIRPEAPYSTYVCAALANTTTSNGVFGVKMHWYQVAWFLGRLRALTGADRAAADAAVIAQWLPHPHYVHLYRDDTVRQAISFYRAISSGKWFHLADGEQDTGEGRSVRPVPTSGEPDWGHIRFLEDAVIRQERGWREFFARSGIVPLEVRYEDMVVAYEDTLRRVLDFIGVAVPPHLALPSPRLQKQADEETERLAEEYLAHRDTVTAHPVKQSVAARAPWVPRGRAAARRALRSSTPLRPLADGDGRTGSAHGRLD